MQFFLCKFVYPNIYLLKQKIIIIIKSNSIHYYIKKYILKSICMICVIIFPDLKKKTRMVVGKLSWVFLMEMDNKIKKSRVDRPDPCT
jgi:hypothetical protein